MDEGTSEYSINWDGHVHHVRKAFNRLLESNELCDVTLYVEGKKIGAHKVFLSACSKYFEQLFKDFKQEHPIIVLKGVQFDILKHILNFIYNGEVNIEVERFRQFLEAAAFLKIEGLTRNTVKRKRKDSFVNESDNVNIRNTQPFTSGLEADSVDRSGQTCNEEISRTPYKNTLYRRSPKLYKIDNSANKNQLSFKRPDFSKAPEICKYSIDTNTSVGEFLSDYEFTSQSSVMESPSQSPRHENIEDLTIGENIEDTPAQENTDQQHNKPPNFETINVKSECIDDSDVEEISSFDQNDFANSLDDEIDISDDVENVTLEKQLTKSVSDDGEDDIFEDQLTKDISDGHEDDTLEKQLMKTALASVDEKGLHLCKICGKSYVKKDSLKKHFAVHVNNTTCMICGRILSRRTHLLRHMKTHGKNSK